MAVVVPEVHDSDGLSMWTRERESACGGRSNNSWRAMALAFWATPSEGLRVDCRRHRNYDHYQDNVFYDRRPSVWVEPKGEWEGKGGIHLVEIPTDDEIHDNIVCVWVPEKPAVAGSEFDSSYRLHWLADEPYPTPLARCIATRLGNGGQPGKPRPRACASAPSDRSASPVRSMMSRSFTT